MAKTIFEEMGGTYTQVGDYLLPDLELPEEEQQSIGVWGQRHRRYLKEHRRATYATLLTSGKLNDYLADIDRQAETIFSRLVNQMAKDEGVTEQLKADNQMEWVRRMNNIRNRATPRGNVPKTSVTTDCFEPSCPRAYPWRLSLLRISWLRLMN